MEYAYIIKLSVPMLMVINAVNNAARTLVGMDYGVPVVGTN